MFCTITYIFIVRIIRFLRVITPVPSMLINSDFNAIFHKHLITTNKVATLVNGVTDIERKIIFNGNFHG